MYKKVHLDLTILCAGITAAIMVSMSLIYLYISEAELHRNHFNSFKNDMNTITMNLESQSTISMEWLSRMETQGNYIFYVLDNGIPYLYNILTDSSEKSIIFEEAIDTFKNYYSIVLSEQNSLSTFLFSTHIEYTFTSTSTGNDYYACVIEIDKNSSTLQVIILSLLDSLEKQIFRQRIQFLLINIVSIILLSIFSWIFTGKLLKPILENQKKQAQFIASASHELRTPLAVILSSAESCKEASPDKQSSFLETIKQEGFRMSALIEDMLTLSSSDNQRFSVRMMPVELDTLLLNSCEAFEALAKKKHISISLDLPENTLPLCSCDADRIRQVISILLHNAISYTKEEGSIKLSLSYHKEQFCISVTDNGIGISDEDKKRIFDRFYRVEKSRSTKGHFGLGLSIAYEIVKSHNGTIGVKDASGGGSVFYINLPSHQ
ncbi:sensor histidine kinase [Parablautia muri]|uniref:histidine kinase n=1 Tax=Parablautia muri TaxID=2320879 RepID=A0A9X5BCE0_9FIRM|nr:HAMP domain-containing sensor histidine kinase [Parablautia muri]NBJ91037.1 sensor histidine kinase [Parablautia muri]